MAASALPNVSKDVFWAIVQPYNSFLVKSKKNGGVQFSRDPFNLTNCHSRKYAGFINEKAVGIAPAEKNGVVFLTKKASAAHQPAKAVIKTAISGAKPNRKVYRAVAVQTAKQGYRADLRAAAIERASAIKQSQRPVKAEPELKLRGKKAKKAAESA